MDETSTFPQIDDTLNASRNALDQKIRSGANKSAKYAGTPSALSFGKMARPLCRLYVEHEAR